MDNPPTSEVTTGVETVPKQIDVMENTSKQVQEAETVPKQIYITETVPKQGSMVEDKKTAEGSEDNDKRETIVIAAVQTRTQIAKEARAPGALKMSAARMMEINPEILVQEQYSDPTVSKYFKLLAGGRKRKGFNTRATYYVKHNILYHRYTYGSGKESQQLIVPSKFRQMVLEVERDGIMSGDQGVKNTVNRITEELFWPGAQSDTKTY